MAATLCSSSVGSYSVACNEVQRLFITRDYENALARCLDALGHSLEDSSAPTHRALCLRRNCDCFPVVTLAIQLLGETSKFDRIMPFCLNWYGEMSLVPAYVLSIACVSLVAGNQVSVAEDALSRWHGAVSKNWTTFCDIDVNLLATTAVCEVYCPQRKFSFAEEFINKLSPVLSSATITDLRDHVRCLTVSPPSPGTPATPINGDTARLLPQSPADDGRNAVAVFENIIRHLFAIFQRAEVVATLVYIACRRFIPAARRRVHFVLALAVFAFLRAYRMGAALLAKSKHRSLKQ